jgi:RNA polymerase sigma-70 factor (ECF subfamily)
MRSIIGHGNLRGGLALSNDMLSAVRRQARVTPPGERRYPSSVDEAALAIAAREDPDAFARLYDRTVSEVYRFALSLTHDHARAEDVTSETYRRALRGIGSYEDRGKPFVAWLLTIARNLVRDAARRNGRETALMEHDQPVAAWPGDGAVKAEERRALQRALARLPASQRRVIVLRYGHEWSCREVGERMGKSEAAVKQLSYRAVQRLRELMGEEGFGDDYAI